MQDSQRQTRLNSLFYGAFLIGSLLAVQLPCSAEQNVNPGINQHYQNPDFKHWVSIFERPGREVYDQRHAIVDVLAIQPGMAIADVGAGTGLFTRLFAQRVGESGKVYAVDISQNFIDNILQTANAQGLKNISGVISNQHDSKLPVNSVDLIFICDTYHHFEYPQTMLSSIHQALKTNGRLVIIDFVKKPGSSSDWIMTHVRADKHAILDEIQQAGFNLISESKLLKSNYFLQFDKKNKTN